mgnify:CR=1 FL=1
MLIIEKKIKQDKLTWGFTLLEILVATILLASIVIGLSGVLISSRRFSMRIDSRVQAAYLASFYLEPLQMDVMQESNPPGNGWLSGNNCVSNGAGCDLIPNNPIDSMNFNYVPGYPNLPITPVGAVNVSEINFNVTWLTR